MFLLDDLLLLPITAPVSGFRWVMKQIQTMADRELLNDEVWKERLIELQMRLEIGEISEEDFAVEEAVIFQQLREIRARREEMMREAMAQSRDDEGEGVSIDVHTGYGQ